MGPIKNGQISPIDSLGTHEDYSKQTTCPGKYLSAYFENGHIKKEPKKL